jgi:hypothetical protein
LCGDHSTAGHSTLVSEEHEFGTHADDYIFEGGDTDRRPDTHSSVQYVLAQKQTGGTSLFQDKALTHKEAEALTVHMLNNGFVMETRELRLNEDIKQALATLSERVEELNNKVTAFIERTDGGHRQLKEEERNRITAPREDAATSTAEEDDEELMQQIRLRLHAKLYELYEHPRSVDDSGRK